MKKIKKIIILGAGGNSRDIVDTINDINDHLGITYECLGFLDDDKTLWRKNIMGVKILGPIKDACNFSDCFFVNGVYSVKNFFTNEEIIKRSNIPHVKFETIIHPSVNISRTVKVNKGSVLLRNVTIMSNVTIGKYVTIHSGTVISHDNKINEYTFVANAVSTGGYVKIGRSCFIGMNSTIRDRVQIGDYSIIGMGSVILNDVPGNSIYVGNPARFFRGSRK